MNKYEGQKLYYHFKRLNEWDVTGDCYPIQVEIAPSEICNHNCCFCSCAFLDRKHMLSKEVMLKAIDQFVKVGVKSIVFAGSGEPTMNKHYTDAIIKCNECGIDTALTTNGVLISEKDIAILADNLRWIRFSINAFNKDTYRKVHRCQPEDFDKVIGNLINLVNYKEEHNSQIEIGVQLVMIEDNIAEGVWLAESMKKVGVDYFVMRPFYQMPWCEWKGVTKWNMIIIDRICDELWELSTDKFSAVLRRDTLFENKKKEKGYNQCLALPFAITLEASGDIYMCFPYRREDFSIGNMYKQDFKEIWLSERRQQVLKKIEKLDKNECQMYCRHHKMNQFLWGYKNEKNKSFI